MEVGSVIGGRYRLVRRVGEGAMAQIWEAEHLTLGRPVAIKFLHTVGSPQSEASQRFVREARVAAAVKHRNVVDIVDFGVTEEDHRPYMVMELLHGKTLNDYLAARTRLGIGEAARIVSDVLRGLAAVHDAGIVHRDLKPDNIILVEDEDGPFPKLVDFGLSRKVGRGDMTAEGIILGTPDYMSPEQAQGQRHIDARTDIYSMGVIFYELVTGQMPFDGGSLAELLTHVVDGKYTPLTQRLPDAPGLLVDIVARAMHKDRNQRFANAREMRAALATANLAPFGHADSGLMLVEPAPGRQAGGNPPSGVFRDPGPDRKERATVDEESQPESLRIGDIDFEPTRIDPSGPVALDAQIPRTAVALAPTLPAAPAPILTPPRKDPSLSRHRDDSAGVHKVGAEPDAPRSRTPWGAIAFVILLASVAGGVLVYWLRTGGLPFLDGGLAGPAIGVTPLDGGPSDGGGDAPPIATAPDVPAPAVTPEVPSEPIEPDAPVDVVDAGTEPDAAAIDEEPERRPTKIRRRRPRPRPRRR